MSNELDGLKDLCQICYGEKFKYKCPKCATKTCCLECVKKHKAQSQCDGKIDNTKFVKRSEFQDNENLVHRDYNFLMNLNRTIEISKTDVRSKGKKILSNYHNSNNNKRFQRAAPSNSQYETIVKRSVKIRKLPRGMQRANMNKSCWDKKKNKFVWTLEFILLDPENGKELSKHYSPRVPEETKVKDTIHPKLKEELGEAPLFFFLKKIDRPASNPQYIPLNNEHLLADVLRDQTVIEYPTILVSTKESVHSYEVYESDESESESSEDSSSDSSSSDESSDDDSDDEPEEISSKVPVESIKEIEERNDGEEINVTDVDKTEEAIVEPEEPQDKTETKKEQVIETNNEEIQDPQKTIQI